MRIYHLAGTQHIMGATMPAGVCALPPNQVDPRSVMRALLVALDRWVSDDTTPPASAYPKLADRTLVPFAQWRFPSIPGVQRPLHAGDRREAPLRERHQRAIGELWIGGCRWRRVIAHPAVEGDEQRAHHGSRIDLIRRQRAHTRWHGRAHDVLRAREVIDAHAVGNPGVATTLRIGSDQRRR